MRTTTLLFAFFLVLSATGYGQFKKGATLLGGDLSFSTQTNSQLNADDQKSSSFVFSPVFAKAIKENLFFGGSLIFGSTNGTYNTNGETKSRTYGGGIFVRRYKNVFGKISAFVQGGLNATVLDGESNQGVDLNTKTNGFSLYASLTPGISVAVSKKLYLEAGFQNLAQVGYSQQKQKGYNFGNNIDNKITSFNFSSSLSTESAGLYFGARFILPH